MHALVAKRRPELHSGLDVEFLQAFQPDDPPHATTGTELLRGAGYGKGLPPLSAHTTESGKPYGRQLRSNRPRPFWQGWLISSALLFFANLL